MSWRRFAKAPPVSHIAAAMVLTLVYAYWSSVPGGLLAGMGFAAFLFAPVGLVVAAGLAADYARRVQFVIRDRSRASLDRGRAKSRSWLRWVVTPVCVVALVAGIGTAWPVRFRFELSRSAFEDVVRKLEAGADPSKLVGRIGFLPVSSITRYGAGGVYFQTGLSGFNRVGIDRCSFDYGCINGQLYLDDEWAVDMH